MAPRFGLNPANLAAVVEICRRLDGLPLAIELACARLRTLSVEEIARRLGDRFRLLTGGSRTALPRHQTLAAVVGWSWDLFDDSERRLARRLAVFAGGADIDAGLAVRLVNSLGWYWGLGGGTGESAGWLREVTALAGLDEVPAGTRAVLYAYDAVHQFSAGNLDRAGASAGTAIALADGASPDSPVVPMVGAVVGTSSVAEAMTALSSLVDHPDPWLAAAATLIGGHRAESDGDAGSARDRYARARDRFVAVGEPVGHHAGT